MSVSVSSKHLISAALSAMFSLIVMVSPQPAYADGNSLIESSPDQSLPNSVMETDRELYLELIKLSRFNAKFQLESNYHQPWRTWTYPLGREAGTAASFAGSIVDISQQARGLDKPKKISRRSVEKGIYSAIAGSAVSGSASALELAQNTWVMWQARKHGYSPKASIEYVRKILDRTTELIDHRRTLAAKETSPHVRQIHELEDVLLRRIRHQLLYEFRTWSCHSRDLAWRENTFFTVDAAQNYMRMFAGIRARQALFRHSRLGGTGVILGLVANSIATVNPIFRNVVGLTVRKVQEHKLAKEFPNERPPEFPRGMSLSDLTDFEENHPSSVEEQLATAAVLLNDRSEKLDKTLDREMGQIERYRQVAQQQSVSGPIIGLLGVGGSVCSTVGYFGLRHNPRSAIRTAFGGRIATATGQGYALLNTPYTSVKGWIKAGRARKHGELPSQILDQRLRSLDEFEKEVKSFTPY